MALPPLAPEMTTSSIAALAVLIMMATTLSEVFCQPPTFSSAPAAIFADCGTRLLSLAPCAPFVQGSVPAPTQQCCDSLKVVYSQQPGCLCLFLNGIALRSLPFNASLALDLPGICSPLMNPSFCSTIVQAPTAPTPADPVLSPTNSTVSPIAVPPPGTPMVTVTPIPSNLLGFGQSAAHKLGGGVFMTSLMLAVVTTLWFINIYEI